MPIFNLTLKIIISAVILYVVINGYFRYHVYNNIIYSSLVFAYLIILIIYNDLNLSLLFVILLSSLLIIAVGLDLFFKFKKKKNYYWLLNANKNDYERIKNYFNENSLDKLEVTYNKKTPWFLAVNYKAKETNKLMKGFEKAENKLQKRFTICNYWQIITFLIMMVVLWRF